jgi:nucleoside-diphosphate-sugar epimerase
LIGASGFIGRETLAALGANPAVSVTALVRSEEAAKAVSKLGALAIVGDLERAGDWRALAARVEVVVHAAQPPTFGGRIDYKEARRYEAQRLAMDNSLFDALGKGDGRRLVYVSGNSFFGETGAGAALDETMKPQPTGFGPYIRSAVPKAESQSERGFDVVVAFPGAVYGPGSWLKQYFIDPIRAGKPVMQVGGPPKWASPIAVNDCGRAIAHLALMPRELLKTRTERFFVVDDKPVTYDEIAQAVGKVLGKPARVRRIPGFMLQLFAGGIIRSYMETNSKYRNEKLKSTGFALNYPTIESGLPALIKP